MCPADDYRIFRGGPFETVRQIPVYILPSRTLLAADQLAPVGQDTRTVSRLGTLAVARWQDPSQRHY